MNNLIHDFMKWFGYFARISTLELNISFGGSVLNLQPPSIISISSLLYRSDKCQGCHKCCYFNWNFWAGCEEHPDAEKQAIMINDEPKIIIAEPHKAKYCLHLTDGCNIHNMNPIHCRMPLMKFKKVKDKVYITKEQYGRNWAFGCPIAFGPYDDSAYNEDLFRLYKVKRVAEYFEIPTVVDTIIDMISEGKSGIVWENNINSTLF